MVGIFLDVSTAPVSGCTPDWLGASKNNCSEERGEAATLCTLCTLEMFVLHSNTTHLIKLQFSILALTSIME